MSQVDLSALRIDASQAVVPRRPLGPRLLVFAVAALAIAIAATFFVPLVWPARIVRMATVQVAEHNVGSNAAVATEAVGWVEPDPFPFIVRPLITGHIETLEVLEGAAVKAGETVIARLASAELTAACDRAKVLVTEQRAQLARARANLVMSNERLKQNADAHLRLLDARTKLATAQTKLATATARRVELQAKAVGARAHLKAQQQLEAAGQSFPVALDRARADADAAQASVAANEAEATGLASELAEQQRTVALCEQLAADPVDLRGAVAIATAEVQQAEASLEKAQVNVEIAARELGWATVLAPVDGVVLRLEAEPGDIVGHGAKGIVALYDPKKLRARIDVPIDSLRGIREGQEVDITSEAIGNVVVKGIVQRLQHETDLLKNTLQVKIELQDPPALLRPETLCRAQFLASRTPDSTAATTITAFRVPAGAVQGGVVFVFDPQRGIARAVRIEVLRADGDMRVVRGDLSPTHRVVLDSVVDGEAIQEGKP
jgi:HlyD family secretion protein